MADFTDDEAKHLVNVFKDLGVKPKGDTPDEVQSWMIDYLTIQGKLPTVESPPCPKVSPVTHNVSVTTRIPSISSFSGNSSIKNENFDNWKYEVQCLLIGNQYNPEAIAEAVRRSLKGEASRVVQRLGVRTSVPSMLTKLDGVFGNVHLAEDILAKFYNAQQLPDEDVALWSCRIEDLLEQASAQKSVCIPDKHERLRNKLYSGLKDSLKSRTHHLFVSISDYDELRIQLRRVEYDMNKRPETESQCAPIAQDEYVQTTQSHTPLNATVSSVSGKNKTAEYKHVISQLTQENKDLKQELKSKTSDESQLQQTYFAGVSQNPGRGNSNYVNDNRYSNTNISPTNASVVSDSSATNQPSNTNAFNAHVRPWYPQQPPRQPIYGYQPLSGYQHRHYPSQQPQSGYENRRRIPKIHQQCWRCGQFGHLQYECNILLNKPLN